VLADGDLVVERGRLLLRALLVIPQGELDDTHFEKLQSRLISHCQGSSGLLDSFLDAGAAETVQVASSQCSRCYSARSHVHIVGGRDEG
jgi:hypothetical protein